MVSILYCPQMKDLALRLCSENKRCLPGEISWNYFQDGFPNLKVMEADSLRNRHVAFLASLDSPGEIFSQLSVIYELPRLAIRSLKVILPYYPTGTMERVEEKGQVATAASLARMLSLIPGTMSGPVQIIIYDIHALQERFYFSDNVIPRLETAIPLLRRRIKDLSNPAIAFPDEGAWKRFGRMFTDYPLITAHKVREKNGRRVIIQEGDPRGRHVIIVDDLVMTGGTIIQCRDALLEAGAEQVSAYVTHGVFPGDSWQRFAGEGFSFFWMTDSCPLTTVKVKDKKPFEILSLAGDISEKLLDI